MKKTHLSIGKNKNIAICIAAGLLAALLITYIFAIMMTSLIEKGKLSEDGVVGVFITRLIATVVGGLLSAGMTDKKLLPSILGTSAAYLLSLLGIGIVLFNGYFYKLWIGVLSVVLGAIIALLIKLKPQKIQKKSIRIRR